MKTRLVAILWGAAMPLLLVLVLSPPLTRAAQEDKTGVRLETVPDGYVMISVEVLPLFVDEPSRHFHRARENFLKRDYKQAAEPIRKAAAIMQLEAARAAGEPKKTLMASIDELNGLADKVEQGKVKSTRPLDEAFARAHYALANHHLAKARELWARKRPKRAGQDIKAAAIHLQDGWAWTGEEMPQDAVTAIKDARTVGMSLAEGNEKGKTDVTRVLDNLAAEIKKLESSVSSVR